MRSRAKVGRKASEHHDQRVGKLVVQRPQVDAMPRGNSASDRQDDASQGCISATAFHGVTGDATSAALTASAGDTAAGASTTGWLTSGDSTTAEGSTDLPHAIQAKAIRR
jgi:hypothetical protein